MGRLLEALKHKETSQPDSRDKAFFEDALENVAALDSSVLADDAVHFIEVGPNRKMEGSPQVMSVKHPPQTHVQPPHQAAERMAARSSAPIEVRSLTPAPARPLAVALEPWPPTSTPWAAKGASAGQRIAPEIITYHQPEHPISRQYVNLALKLQEGWKSGSSQTVLLTGSRSQVGTSTVLLNLAVAAAQAKVAGSMGRIAVVDANWRRPALAQRLGYVGGAGLQDVLLGRLALEQAVVPTAVPGLHLLPGQSIIDGRPLKAEAVRWLFNWLSENYSFILVDGPSPGESGDLSILTSACDGIYLVVPADESSQTQHTMARTLAEMGGRLRGLLNTTAQ